MSIFYNFFPIYKNVCWILSKKKTKKGFKKRGPKRIKMLLKKSKTKIVNILINDKEVFLENKKQKFGLKQYKNLTED